jgi:hypothetical protein
MRGSIRSATRRARPGVTPLEARMVLNANFSPVSLPALNAEILASRDTANTYSISNGVHIVEFEPGVYAIEPGAGAQSTAPDAGLAKAYVAEVNAPVFAGYVGHAVVREGPQGVFLNAGVNATFDVHDPQDSGDETIQFQQVGASLNVATTTTPTVRITATILGPLPQYTSTPAVALVLTGDFTPNEVQAYEAEGIQVVNTAVQAKVAAGYVAVSCAGGTSWAFISDYHRSDTLILDGTSLVNFSEYGLQVSGFTLVSYKDGNRWYAPGAGDTVLTPDELPPAPVDPDGVFVDVVVVKGYEVPRHHLTWIDYLLGPFGSDTPEPFYADVPLEWIPI